MSSHVRSQLRAAIVSALTGLTTTGARVYPSRVYPVDESKLPFLHVFTQGEDVSPATMGGMTGQLERNLRVSIQAVLALDSNHDELLDTIFSEVETALNASLSTFTLGSLAKGGIRLDSIEDPDLDHGGDQALARITMNWIATYRTVANAPNIAI